MLESVLPLRESTFEMRPVFAEAKLDGLKTLEEELPNNTTAIYPGRLGFFFFFLSFLLSLWSVQATALCFQSLSPCHRCVFEVL